VEFKSGILDKMESKLRPSGRGGGQLPTEAATLKQQHI
jgi:hypothetical protein